MDYAGGVTMLLQFFFAAVIGIYCWNLIKGKPANHSAVQREAKKEIDKLQQLRKISLTVPLAEKTRPTAFREIIGQEDGLKALRAVLCGPNPQHVLIYGPPGVGKTAAARLVLEEAKASEVSPFLHNAKFVELDATTARFDERGIADPLIGSVHDPIYQGAGALGAAGVPQPKAGAVTKAHGGILFVDEIGELHPIQMNKLLKVLEDRKVFFDSSYYSSEDDNIPSHIHDIFQNGMPADFRLIGATTRMAQDIPPAIRSRCVEIFFRPLAAAEMAVIAENAAHKIGFPIEAAGLAVIKRFAQNGRDAVNIVQIAAGAAMQAERQLITAADVEWVVNFGQYSPRFEYHLADGPQIGFATGLGVAGVNVGCLLEIEASARPNPHHTGKVIVTGIIEEEEMATSGRTMRRKSMAKSSLDNVMTVLAQQYGIDFSAYDIHVNFPNASPIDGPSAGITMAAALYSAVGKIPIHHTTAMTGELSLRGYVKPVGGVSAKIAAAEQAGLERVLIPAANWQHLFERLSIEIIPIQTLADVFAYALAAPGEAPERITQFSPEWVAAASVKTSGTYQPDF